jgi:hypothetical protein
MEPSHATNGLRGVLNDRGGSGGYCIKAIWFRQMWEVEQRQSTARVRMFSGEQGRDVFVRGEFGELNATNVSRHNIYGRQIILMVLD